MNLKKEQKIWKKNQFAPLWANASFFTKYQSYLEIICEAENHKDFLNWIGYLESRFIALITETERISNNRLIVHIWPAAFKNEDIACQYQCSCIYFIGLEVIPSLNGEQHRFSITDSIEKFQLACFGWDGYKKTMNMQIKRTKGDKLVNLQLELFDIDHMEMTTPVSLVETTASPQDQVSLSKNKKFHTVEEIYKRIKNDPNLDAGSFVVGYVDRFVGIKEIAFSEFRTKEGIDSAKFIPFHRVAYFKQNGIIVWDKEKRMEQL